MIKKKIAHLIGTNFYGGPEKQIIEHLKLIDSSIFSPLVISFIEGDSENEFLKNAELNKIKNLGIPMNGPLDFHALITLVKYIKKEKIDLLCVHGYKSTIFGFIAAKINGCSAISFSRGYTAENLKIKFYEWLERKFLNHMDGIISVSHGQESKLETLNVKPKKKWVVHNAVSTYQTVKKAGRKEIAEMLNLPPESKWVVSAGRLSPEKGHRFFIEAINQISKIPDDYYFIICGDGVCLSELEVKAKKMGIIEKCRFPGFLRNVQDLFSIMEFMVLPSLTEGLPNVVLEAFSVSKTVVSTSVGGVPELVEDNKNGLLVSHSDSKALANAIEKFIHNPELASEYGKKGYETVKSQFSFEIQTKKLQKIYLELL
ncbi:MAG: glycosyltransferase [Pseudomonadota bacterium]